jgi:putative DNA primase/helicase
MADGADYPEISPPRLILNPAAPLDSAREFLRRHHHAHGQRTLHHQNGAFFIWQASHYIECAPEEIRASLYQFLDTAFCMREHKEGEAVIRRPAPFQPNKSRVANVLEAAAAEAQLPTYIRPPTWLDGRQAPPPAELIAFTNGLLHLPTRKLIAHTPALFALNALPFAYDPAAQLPLIWLNFLNALWPDDKEAIATLQEMFGLFLTGETRHQKAFLIVGPKRSGKGTIARILTQLLGQDNVCGPTLSSISQNFGMAPLIGKRLAVISDARLSGKADQQIIVERLLSVTGEDSLTIDRKFLGAWTGRLETRFLILTNEVPKLADASGALASRFITLILRQSFYGKEDHALTDKLLAELPGILKWALEGWDCLRARGHLVAPASSQAVQREMEDLGSPIGAFVRDCCMVEAGGHVACDHLYNLWCEWCRDQNREHVGTVQDFGRNLRATVPGLAVTNNRTARGGPRERRYEGIRALTVGETEDARGDAQEDG